MITVTSVRLPNVAVGEEFTLELLDCMVALRAGIDPGGGVPTVWFQHALSLEKTPTETVERRFVVVEHTLGQTAHKDVGGRVVVHLGMWWAAASTYHLFEIFPRNPEP